MNDLSKRIHTVTFWLFIDTFYHAIKGDLIFGAKRYLTSGYLATVSLLIYFCAIHVIRDSSIFLS